MSQGSVPNSPGRSSEAYTSSCFRSLVIYNPTLSNGKEERAMDNILFFYPHGVDPNKQMNHVGLCIAVMCIVERFQPAFVADEIRTDKRCITVFSPCRDVYMALEADELYDAAVCTPLLRKAYYSFLVRHGPEAFHDPRGRGEFSFQSFFNDFSDLLDRYVMNIHPVIEDDEGDSSAASAPLTMAASMSRFFSTNNGTPSTPRSLSGGGRRKRWAKDVLSEALLHSPLRLQSTTTYHYTTCASIVAQYLSLITAQGMSSTKTAGGRRRVVEVTGSRESPVPPKRQDSGASLSNEDENGYDDEGEHDQGIVVAATDVVPSPETAAEEDHDQDASSRVTTSSPIQTEGSIIFGSVNASPNPSHSKRQTSSSVAFVGVDNDANDNDKAKKMPQQQARTDSRSSSFPRASWSTARCLLLRRDDRKMIYSTCGHELSLHLTFLSMIESSLTSFMLYDVFDDNNSTIIKNGGASSSSSSSSSFSPPKYCCVHALEDVIVFLVVDDSLHSHVFHSIDNVASMLAVEMSTWMRTGTCRILQTSQSETVASSSTSSINGNLLVGAGGVLPTSSSSSSVTVASAKLNQELLPNLSMSGASTTATLNALRDGSSWICWNNNLVHGAVLANYPRLVQWSLGNLLREAIVTWRLQEWKHVVDINAPLSMLADGGGGNGGGTLNHDMQVPLAKRFRHRIQRSLVETWVPMGTDGWIFVCQRHGRIVGIPFYGQPGGGMAYLLECFASAEKTIDKLYSGSHLLATSRGGGGGGGISGGGGSPATPGASATYN